MRTRALLATLAAASLAACAADDGGGDPGTVDAAAVQIDAAGPPPTGNASLTGAISRTAAPQGDARGDVYVALFDKDPVVDMTTAQVVGRALVTGADLSASGAHVTYTIEGIAARSADYYLVAFLDDNDNVDTSNPDGAGPDRGDLVSLDGLASPKVAVTSDGVHTHDIVLNSVLPF